MKLANSVKTLLNIDLRKADVVRPFTDPVMLASKKQELPSLSKK